MMQYYNFRCKYCQYMEIAPDGALFMKRIGYGGKYELPQQESACQAAVKQ